MAVCEICKRWVDGNICPVCDKPTQYICHNPGCRQPIIQIKEYECPRCHFYFCKACGSCGCGKQIAKMLKHSTTRWNYYRYKFLKEFLGQKLITTYTDAMS